MKSKNHLHGDCLDCVLELQSWTSSLLLYQKLWTLGPEISIFNKFPQVILISSDVWETRRWRNRFSHLNYRSIHWEIEICPWGERKAIFWFSDSYTNIFDFVFVCFVLWLHILFNFMETEKYPSRTLHWGLLIQGQGLAETGGQGLWPIQTLLLFKPGEIHLGEKN